MIRPVFSTDAEKGAVRYGMMCESWKGLFERALNQADFGSFTQITRTINEAYEIAGVFIDGESSVMMETLTAVAKIAHTATIEEIASIDSEELSERTHDFLSATQSYLYDEIIAQIHRDIAYLRQTMQRVALEVSVAARSRGISERRAMIEYRIGNQRELNFLFYDRTNRKWSSKKFIRAVWRHTLLSAYNETVMLTLSDHGLTRARVQHEDPNSQVNGMIISFGANHDLPTYSEIRDTVFHPNSNAVLRMERVDVQA